MDLSSLFPSMEKLKLIQGIENNLLKRRRLANISIAIAIAASLLQVLVDVIAKNYQIQHLATYFYNFGKFIYDLVTFNWAAASQYEPVWELAGFFCVLLFLVFFIILKRTKFLFKYSEEPFRYTFWVEPFKHVKDTESEVHKIDEDDRFHYLLHHDLMEKLNERIHRLSLLDAKALDSKLKHNLSSHIHIEGHFTIRNLGDDHCSIQLMPRIRIGPQENPVTLAKPIEFKLGFDSAACQLMSLEKSSGADPYDRIVEHLYSRIATEIYRQIKSDLNEKIQLFPSKYLRAVALFHEAEDFSRSNTIDAYEHAIGLYKKSLRCFDITFIPAITKFLIKFPFIWRFGINVQHTLARVQIGYAKCQLYRRIISALSGRYLNPLFEIRSSLKGVISSLVEIHNRITPKLKLVRLPSRQAEPAELEDTRRENHFNTSMAYLTFPKDSWKRFVFLRPNQALFERQKRIFFDANVVLSITHTHLESIQRAKYYLEDAKAIAPALSERNALFLVARALSEPELEKRIALLSLATEVAPDFEIAQFMFAYYLEMQFRMRDEIDAARGISVLNQYDRVLKINPGNIASLASQGYIKWLLDQSEESKRKLEEGTDIKAIVSDTFIGTLNYGLARIEAEDGNFDKSYDLFNEALSSDPGVGAWSLESEKTDRLFQTSYFDYIGKSMLKRYRQFKENVEAIIDGSTGFQNKKRAAKSKKTRPAATKKTISRVHSFVLNDYGNACLNYYHRFGDWVQLENAIEAYEDAIEKDPEYKIAYFNLQNAYDWRNNPEDIASGIESDREKGIQLLKDITGFGPTWPLAITSLARARLKIGQEQIKDLLRKANAEIGEAEAGKKDLRPEDPGKKMRKISREILDDREQQSIAHKMGLERKDRENRSTRDDKDFFRVSTQSKPAYRAIQQEALDSKQIELQKSIGEHIKNAKSYFKQARELSQNYTEIVLPEVEKIVHRTKLSSIYRGYKFDVAGQGIDDFLNQKAKVNKDRLDENDVEALMVWVEVLSNNYQNLEQNLLAIKDLVNYIQEEYYPESSKLNLILRDMNELRQLYYKVQSALEEVDKKRNIAQCEEEIKSYSRPIETMIECWLGNDPNHWASLLWAKEFFDEETYIQYLKGATRNAIKQNELGEIYVAKGKYERALKYYKKALAIDERPIYACNLGRSYGYLGDWNQMIEHCRHAVDLHKQATSDPHQLDYYFDYLADGYCNADRLDEFNQLLEDTEDFKNEPVKKANFYYRIGNYFFDKNNNDKAIDYYRKAIENNDQRPIYESSLGQAYGNLGKFNEMIQHCSRAVKLRREAAWDAYGLDYYYEILSEGYYKANRLPEFEELFKETIDLVDAPDKKAIVYNRIGNLLANDSQNVEAISYYQKAIQLDPEKPIYLCNIGVTYGNLKEWNDMVIYCKQAIERRRIKADDAYSLDYYYNFLAEGYYNTGRLSEFEDFLEKANDFSDKPRDIGTIYNWIGIMLFGDGRNDEAITYYEKGIAYDDQRPIFECNLGRAFGALENWDEMIRHCHRAVDLRKTVVKDSYEMDYYYEYLADGYVQSGRDEEFDRILEETEDLKFVPEKKGAIYNQIGNFFFDKDKNEKAVAYYKKAIEHNRQKPIYECNLGRAYGKLAKYKEMIHHCTRAVDMRRNAVSDTYAMDYYYDFLAEGYYRDNQLQAFEHIFEKTDDFDNTPEKRATIYNRIGNLLANETRSSEAILYYQKAIGLDPQKPIYLCNIGITYGKLKQWDKMIDHCRQAVELKKTAPDDAYGLDYYYNFLAEAYFSADRLSEFEDHLESSQDFSEKPEEIGTVYNRIANLFFDKAKDTEAITYYKKAIAHDSQRPIYQCNLGRTYGNLGNWNEMIGHCTTAVEMRRKAATDDYDLNYYYQYLAEGYVQADKPAQFDRFLDKNEDLNSVPDKKALVYNRMANLLFDKYKYEDAIAYYRKAIEHDSQNPIFECNLGRTYGKLENWDEMIQHCDRAVALRRNVVSDPYGPDYYYEFLAEGYHQANRLPAFIEILETTKDFIGEPQKIAPIYNRIANWFIDKNKNEEAVTYYRKAIEHDSQNPIFECNLGRTYGKLENWDEMIQHCEKAVELRKQAASDPYDLDYYYEALARGYLEADRLDEFNKILEEIDNLNAEPHKKAIFHNNIGNWFFEKNKHEDAIIYYRNAIAHDNLKPIYECNLGRAYGNLGNWNEMIQHCQKAVELRKNDMTDSYALDYYYEFLTDSYLKANRLEELKGVLEKAEYFKNLPHNKAQLYNRIGIQLAKAFRDNDALFYYQRAIQLDPQKPIYKNNLGITYGKLGQWDEMINHCKLAIELRRSTPDDTYNLDYYYSNLAEAYFRSDRLSEFENLLESSQDFRDEPEAIGAIYNLIANWFYDAIKDAEAISYYKKAISYDSQKPIYECNLGRTYGNFGKWDEMINHCERAVALRKDTDSDSHGLQYYIDFLEQAYRKAGKIPGQQETMQKAG